MYIPCRTAIVLVPFEFAQKYDEVPLPSFDEKDPDFARFVIKKEDDIDSPTKVEEPKAVQQPVKVKAPELKPAPVVKMPESVIKKPEPVPVKIPEPKPVTVQEAKPIVEKAPIARNESMKMSVVSYAKEEEEKPPTEVKRVAYKAPAPVAYEKQQATYESPQDRRIRELEEENAMLRAKLQHQKSSEPVYVKPAQQESSPIQPGYEEN